MQRKEMKAGLWETKFGHGLNGRQADTKVEEAKSYWIEEERGTKKKESRRRRRDLKVLETYNRVHSHDTSP